MCSADIEGPSIYATAAAAAAAAAVTATVVAVVVDRFTGPVRRGAANELCFALHIHAPWCAEKANLFEAWLGSANSPSGLSSAVALT